MLETNSAPLALTHAAETRTYVADLRWIAYQLVPVKGLILSDGVSDSGTTLRWSDETWRLETRNLDVSVHPAGRRLYITVHAAGYRRF